MANVNNTFLYLLLRVLRTVSTSQNNFYVFHFFSLKNFQCVHWGNSEQSESFPLEWIILSPYRNKLSTNIALMKRKCERILL